MSNNAYLIIEMDKPIGVHVLRTKELVGFAGLFIVAGVCMGQEVHPSARVVVGAMCAANTLMYADDIIAPTFMSRKRALCVWGMTTAAMACSIFFAD